MKRFSYAFIIAAALIFCSNLVFADGLDLAYKDTKNFKTFTGAPATGDVQPVFDASQDEWTTRPLGTGQQLQVTSTTVTLTAAQCGATIVNDSADVLTLPEASTVLGCRYTFAVENASNMDINPNDATDLIRPFTNLIATTPAAISPSAGDAIRCATVGCSITLEAVSANAWNVVASTAPGTGWSDIN